MAALDFVLFSFLLLNARQLSPTHKALFELLPSLALPFVASYTVALPAELNQPIMNEPI